MSAQKSSLTHTESASRKEALTDSNGLYRVNYTVVLSIRKIDDLHCVYEDSKLTFEGICKIKFFYKDLGSLEDLLVDYHGKVHAVYVNGLVSTFFHPTGKLLVSKKWLIENEENVIEVVFTSKYNNKGVGLHHFVDPLDKKEYVYTQFEPFDANLVFPLFDQPDIKAKLNVTIITPEEWETLSNETTKATDFIYKNSRVSNLILSTLYDFQIYCKEGEGFVDLDDHLISSIKDKGYKVTQFNETPAISTYLFALAAGPYICYNNPTPFRIPMRVFMRESLKGCGDPKLFVDLTMAGVNFYESYFNIKFPFSKYDQIYVPEYNFGAMENVGLVTYNEAYAWRGTPLFLRESRFAITVLHELAHMWFGNLVTMKWWDDLWLNEAFATFISYLASDLSLEVDLRFREVSWVNFFTHKVYGYAEDSKSITHSVYSKILDTDQAQSNFDGIVYYKGSSILKQLYYFVGHENFSKGLNKYFNKHSWSNTSYNDFVSVMVEASDHLKKSNFYETGNKHDLSLESMVSEWLTKAGLTSIEVDFEEVDGKITKFDIKQEAVLSQHNNLQTLMIDILFINDDHSQESIQRVIVLPQAITTIHAFLGRKAPKAVILNHNDWAYVKWIICNKTLDYVKNNYEKLSELDRSLVCKSIFDKARDAKVSSQIFLEAVSEFIKAEKSANPLQQLLSSINAAVHYYLPFNHVPKYSEIIFHSIHDKIHYFLGLINESKAKNIVNEEEKKQEEKILLRNEDLTRTLLSNLLNFSSNDNLRDIILNIFTTSKVKDFTIADNIWTKDIRFNYLKIIHQSGRIELSLKTELLAKQVQEDNNSDLAKRAECACKAGLPDLESKKEVWNHILDPQNSLYIAGAYMSSFIVYDQLPLIKDFLKREFFESAIKLAETNNYHLTSAFFTYIAPNYFAEEILELKLCEEYISKTTNHDCIRSINELKDDLIRFSNAHKISQ